jgi:hypothetical protein
MAENIDRKDYEDYDELNETPIPDIVSPEFKNMLMSCKNAIYMGIIYALPEGDPKSQDPKLVDDYLQSISKLKYSLDNLQPIHAEQFPQQAHDQVNNIYTWYVNFLQNNKQSVNRIPYSDYINNVLHVHPYNQNNTGE